MRKVLIVLMAGLMVSLFVFGCGKEEAPKTEPAVEEPVEAMAEDTTMMEDTTAAMDTTVTEEVETEPAGE